MRRLILIPVLLSRVGFIPPNIPMNGSGQDEIRFVLASIRVYRADTTRLEHMPVLRPDMSKIEPMPVLHSRSR